MPFPQRRPFVPRFLHPILPEIALAGSDQRLDLLRRAPLGDGDQGDLFRLAPPDSASSAYLAFVNNPLTTAEPLARIFTALRVAVRGAWLLIWPARLLD